MCGGGAERWCGRGGVACIYRLSRCRTAGPSLLSSLCHIFGIWAAPAICGCDQSRARPRCSIVETPGPKETADGQPIARQISALSSTAPGHRSLPSPPLLATERCVCHPLPPLPPRFDHSLANESDTTILISLPRASPLTLHNASSPRHHFHFLLNTAISGSPRRHKTRHPPVRSVLRPADPPLLSYILSHPCLFPFFPLCLTSVRSFRSGIFSCSSRTAECIAAALWMFHLSRTP